MHDRHWLADVEKILTSSPKLRTPGLGELVRDVEPNNLGAVIQALCSCINPISRHTICLEDDVDEAGKSPLTPARRSVVGSPTIEKH